jgi:hypothetical protein
MNKFRSRPYAVHRQVAEKVGLWLSSVPNNSAGELLQLFRTGEVGTRGQLQRVTRLARSTVTHKVDALLAAGYLVEDGSIIDGRVRSAAAPDRRADPAH